MRVTNIVPSPDQGAVNNTLLLQVTIGIQNGREAIASVGGRLKSNDNRVLCIIHEYSPSSGPDFTLDAGPSDREVFITIHLCAELSARALDHIAERRETTKKADVSLTVELNFRMLSPRITVSSIRMGPEFVDENGSQGNQLVYRYSSTAFYSQQTDLWLLSGDGSKSIFTVNSVTQNWPLVISGSDFVHDFAPFWGMGNFVVLEMPLVELLPANDKLGQHLNRALEEASLAKKALIAGEWDDVLDDLRGVWEVIRNDQDVKALLIADGWTDEAADEFNAAVKNQFNVASKFDHSKDRKGALSRRFSARKEDAYMVYSTAMTFLNLLARKYNRQSKRVTVER
jgi:hypothetical protein